MAIRISQVKTSGAVAPAVVAKREGAGAAVAALRALASSPDFAREADAVAAVVATPGGLAHAAAFAGAALACEDDQAGYTAVRGCALRLLELAAASDDRSWPAVFAAAGELLCVYLEERPAEPLLVNFLGVCLHELNEPAAARRLFRRALALAPDTPDAEGNLAEAERRLRHPLEARFAPGVNARIRPLRQRAERIVSMARPAETARISLCMIVKDEEELLPACLDSVREHVDELIVVDTGSTDRTREIASERGATVIDFAWTGSFSDARNVSLEHATGDWILYLDADEQLVGDDGARLRALAGQTWREGFYLNERNFTGSEELGSSTSHLAFRLFRNRRRYRFEGIVHEQKIHLFPLHLPERFAVCDVRINHYGYLKQRMIDRGKSRRNRELLEREAREHPSPFNDFNLGSEYSWLGDYATARRHYERGLAALQRDPGWRNSQFAPMLVVRLAEALRATEPDAARSYIEEALGWYPDHTELVFERGVLELDAGRLDDAEQAFRRALELGDAELRLSPVTGPGTFLALCGLGHVQRRRGEPDEAAGSFERCVREWPEYSPALLDLVNLLLEHDPDRVEERLLALGVEWTSAACLFVATAFYERRRLEQAESWFRRALERAPGHAPSLVGLGETHLSLRRWDDAEEVLARVPDGHPLAPAALRGRSFAAVCAGNLSAAEKHANALAGSAPDEALLYRAWVALERDAAARPDVPAAAAVLCLTNLEALVRIEEFERFERLLPAFEAAVPDERARRVALARLYERHDFDALALEEWHAVLERFGPDAEVLYGLGRAATRQELWSHAAELLEGAVELDAGHVQARELLALVAQRAA
ncbi:Glycosyl transferase family 2 [Gaiella occulta]|uniref:Glycosyl transferase family 2 n=1 Tax=Gaiella occulta TaxID=1002870 RepID=A0A7M2Z152_9ACTN|nr:TPR domain-containing glycosyltransferase [Gaiella occulta]RDI76011.1 Glycosyl transferase family 2 [Gaiella occulta]